MCTKMVPEEEDRVDKFVRGLLDNIQGNVIAAEPTKLQDAVRIANNLMDQKLKGYAVKNAETNEDLRSIRETTVDNNHHSKDKMLEVRMWRVPTRLATMRENHIMDRCLSVTSVCFTMKALAQSDCPKLKDQNRRNKAGNKNGVGEARGKAYVLGGGEANPDSNVVKGTFLLNNHYASMIFDSGADRSFVSTTFSTLLDITPNTLDVSYAVELADGRISETNTILRGCTLGLLVHPFNIDLMPVELGSFDVIIGMDWLENHHAVIVCDEKIVRIPYGDEVLISEEEHAEHLKLILELLKNEELYAKFSKCDFWLSKVQFLSHVIDSEGIHMDPAKIESNKDWASPKTLTEICQFLGLAGYYQ
ncbi:putative reverse transcriptase domain-containing protein [Tanacetum coccineum]